MGDNVEKSLMEKSLEKNIYDLQFNVITSQDLEKIKEYLSGQGESVDIGHIDLDQNKKLLKVHIHTDHPDKVLRYANAISDSRISRNRKTDEMKSNEMVSNIVLENMVDQYHEKNMRDMNINQEPKYISVGRPQFKAIYDKLIPGQKEIFFDKYVKTIVAYVATIDAKDISKLFDSQPMKVEEKDLKNICSKEYRTK